MNVRLALGSALAFALAIVAGRVLFDSRGQEAATPVVEPVVPNMQKKRENRSFVAGADGKAVKYGYTGWDSVDGGVKNENAHMTHFVSSIYTEGAVHVVPAHKGVSVQWTPTQMEVRMGGDIATVLGKAGPIKGAIEKTDDATLMTFSHTYPDTHEKMFIRADGGMEHDILLLKQPDALDIGMDLAYSGRLNLSKGLRVFQGKTPITSHFRTMEALHFKDSNGNTVLQLRAPFAWDAKITLPNGGMDREKHATKEHARRAVRCEYQIDFDDNGITLAVITPGRWLREEGRAYPVTIDPNFGPFTLNDDSPPFYTAQLGNDTVLPAYNATPLLTSASAGGCNRSTDDRAATIALPFDFNFYGTNFPAGTPLSVYENGYANFQPIIPCQSIFYPTGGCNAEQNFALNSGGDTTGGPCTGPAGLKTFTFYPYWDDLIISSDADSGVYFFVDGDPTTGNQRLVIEWHKMAFFGGDPAARISFNLILFQCESKFSFIIGQAGEVDNRSSTVGVLETQRPSGGRYVQYEFKQGIVGPNDNPNDVIPLGTALAFSQSALPIIAVTPASGLEGCIPFTVCFDVGVTTPVRDACAAGEPRSNAISYLWTYDDNTFSYQGPNPSTTEGATVSQRVCHTYVTQDITVTNGISVTQVRRGTFNVNLTITNEFGATSTVGPFLVRVCDPPDIVVSGTPQGGYSPLDVSFTANAIGVATTTYNNATVPPRWRIFQLNGNDPSQTGTLIATVDDTQVVANNGITRIDYRFTQPGIYRAEIAYNFTDTLAGLTSSFTPPNVPPATGEIFVFVSNPTDVIPDAMIITESKISVNWTDKVDGPDPDGLPPNLNSAVPGEGLPDRPFTDTLTMKGFMNMPGVTLSSLVGKPVRIILNTGTIIFNGLLNADGTALDGDPSTGRTGTFKLSLPSGQFSLNVRGSLARIYGLTQLPDTTPLNRPGVAGPAYVKRLLPVGYRIDIPTVFPPAGFDHSIVTYDYRSAAFQLGPPAVGGAEGFYKFGAFTSQKPASLPNTDGAPNTAPETGKPGGQTLLVSGAFIVTDSKITVKGSLATVDAKGYLSRFGGDDLRPRDDSDVVFSLGVYSEALNFTTTGGFKAKGKQPSQLFTFKRPKAMGKTGVASLQWKNRAGLFQIKTNGLPVDKIGLNTALASQTLVLGLQITPEATQQYIGTSRFEVFKKSATQFLRNAKIKQ